MVVADQQRRITAAAMQATRSRGTLNVVRQMGSAGLTVDDSIRRERARANYACGSRSLWLTACYPACGCPARHTHAGCVVHHGGLSNQGPRALWRTSPLCSLHLRLTCPLRLVRPCADARPVEGVPVGALKRDSRPGVTAFEPQRAGSGRLKEPPLPPARAVPDSASSDDTVTPLAAAAAAASGSGSRWSATTSVVPTPRPAYARTDSAHPVNEGAVHAIPSTPASMEERRVIAATLLQRVERGRRARALVKPWKRVVDSDGDIFWYNENTQSSSWFPPGCDGS